MGILPAFSAAGTASATANVVWAVVPVTLNPYDTLRIGTSVDSMATAACSGDTYIRLYAILDAGDDQYTEARSGLLCELYARQHDRRRPRAD